MPASQGFVTNERSLFIERARLGLWLIIAATIVFVVADITYRTAILGEILVAKSAHLVVVALVLWGLRGGGSKRYLDTLVVLAIGATAASSGAQGYLAGDGQVTRLSASAMLLGAAVLLPWSVTSQFVLSTVLCGVVFLQWMALHGDGPPYPLVGLIIVSGASLLIAREMGRSRQATARAIARMRWHEHALEEFLENAHDLIQWSDTDGRLVYVNRSWRRTLGYNDYEISAMRIRDLLHPDSYDVWEAACAGVLEAPTASRTLHAVFVAKDGSDILVEGHLQGSSAGGAPVRAILRDVTERHMAEEAKRETQMFLRSVLGAVPSLIITVNPEGRILFMNRTVEGFSKEETIGRTIFEYLEPEAHEIASEALRLAEAKRISTSYEVRGAGPLGTISTYFTRVAPIVRSGEVRALALISSDVTEQRKVEDERHREAMKAAALAKVGQVLIRSMEEPTLLNNLCRVTTEVFACDVSHTFLAEEDGAFRVAAGFGDTAEQWETLRSTRVPEPLAEPVVRRLHETGMMWIDVESTPDEPTLGIATRIGITAALYVPLRRGEEIVGLHTIAWRGRFHGLDKWQEDLARGIGDLASLALGTVRLVEELGAANRFKSEFLANMSHELRTPLNIIVGYNDMLLEGACGDLTEEQSDMLVRVQRNARELLGLMNSTLELSRHHTGRMPLKVTEVDVQALLAEIAREARARIGTRPIRVGSVIDAGVGTVWTDAGKVAMVLKNLVDNAIKFTREGEITIGAESAGDGIEVFVRDTGLGIDEAAIGRIFEPFHQASADDPVDGTSGVGLGLYIVRTLVDALGGSVSVQSAVGSGTAFRVWLPQRASEPRAQETDSAAQGFWSRRATA